jgi:DNA-binding transcriptional LysR family regulator
MSYDLADLRLFVGVAEAGNLTRGAKAVHLAPSSASHRISRLEETLGSPVFQRQARGVVLTRAGELLLRHARSVLAQLEQMHADLAPHAAGVRAQVVVWSNTIALHGFLPAHLARFLRAYPQVSITLEEHYSADTVNAVARGQVDVGIVSSGTEDADVESHPYYKDRLVLITPAGHRLAKRSSVRFSDAAGEPFVVLAVGTPNHTFMMNIVAGWIHLNVRVQVRSFDAVCEMVAAGVGIAAVPRSVLKGARAARGCKIVEIDEPWAPRDIFICVKRKNALGPFALALVDQLQKTRNARHERS